MDQGSRARTGRPFVETSEFLALAAGLAAIAVAAALTIVFGATEAWTLVAALAAAYILSRGLTKGLGPEISTAATGDAGRASHVAEKPEPSSRGKAVTVSEEQLYVDRRRRPVERVRLRKYVVTEEVTVKVPVRREKVRLERVALDEEAASPSDSENEMTLMEEEPVVETRVVPKARVWFGKEEVTEEQEVSEVVRREEVDVRQEPPEGAN